MGPPFVRNEGTSATLWNGLGGNGGGPLDISLLPFHGSGGNVGAGNMDSIRNGADSLVDLWTSSSPSMFYCGGNGSLTDGSLNPVALSQVNKRDFSDCYSYSNNNYAHLYTKPINSNSIGSILS